MYVETERVDADADDDDDEDIDIVVVNGSFCCGSVRSSFRRSRRPDLRSARLFITIYTHLR